MTYWDFGTHPEGFQVLVYKFLFFLCVSASRRFKMIF
jgi:hypothetical protein